MLPTAEAALVSLHRGEVLRESELPKKYFAYTPCFRREAGSYRADERGMVRGHQFNKVEMVQFTRPEDSDAAFEELVGKAERLVSGLGFHFRTVKLAAGDCSASMARTYDIEIQIPSMNGYKEVSSVSNARDYQARRGNMRFKRESTGKTELLHTLNGSGLATSRIMPALVEQNQRKDGSVVVPEALRKYLGGLEGIAEYIRNQLKEDPLGEQMTMREVGAFTGGKEQTYRNWQPVLHVLRVARHRGLCTHMKNPRLRRGFLFFKLRQKTLRPRH
jgi:seryl-tRNA synthetase